jgi:oligopeptide transport system substrate-binding protein
MRILLKLLTITCALLGAGCSGDPVSALEGAERKIFLINNRSEPRFLDLQRCNSVAEHQIMLALSEGLVAEKKDSELEVEPGVAEKWGANEKGDVWTFTIRKNAKWSDGVGITAHDFVWSWRRMLSKELGSEYTTMLFLLKNGEPFFKKEVTAEALGVKALDDYTLEVTLVGPTPHFPNIICHTSWWPVPRHAIEKHGSIYDVMNPWTQQENLVSNGPFKMKRYLFKQYVETQRNPHYWDAANVKLDGVRFYPVDKDLTEDRLFRSGQLHATYSTPPSKIPRYLKDHSDIVRNYQNLAIRFYRINTTRKPLNDMRVRQALGFALDRESLVKNVLRANQTPCYGLTPPIKGYETANFFSLDVAKAQQLLAEAGFPGGKGFPELELLIAKSEVEVSMAEAVQAMWRKALGISITIKQVDFPVQLTMQHSKEYDIAVAGWSADYYDPATFVDMWLTDGGNNETGWSNKEFDGLVAAATQCADAQERLRILNRAEAIAAREAPVVPIYVYTRTRLIHPAVKNFQPRALDNWLWKHLDLAYPVPPSSMDALLTAQD